MERWLNKVLNFFTPRDKPKKSGPRQHKKNKNKSEKRQKKQQVTKARVDKHPNILYIGYERKKINNNK
jgi:hypothetical protein